MKKLFLLITGIAAFLAASGQNTMLPADQALGYYQNAAYDKALPLYEKLFKQNQNIYFEPYFDVLLKLKKYDEAGRILKKQLKDAPDSPVYQVSYGRLLQEQGGQEKAKKWYDDVIKKLPPNEFAVRETANAFYRAEAYDYAIKTFQEGRRLLKDGHAFSFDLINLYRYQRNKEMLVQEYLNVLKQNPQMLSRAQNILSSVLETSGDYDIVKRIVLDKLQKEPQSTAYAEFLIWVYLQQKEFSLALRQAVSLDKRLDENGARIFELSFTLLSNKAYDQAAEALNYLISKGKQNIYYIPAKIQLLNTQHQQLSAGSGAAKEKLLVLEQDYLALLEGFGRGKHTISAMSQLAELQAYYLNKPAEAVKLLEEAVQVQGIPASELGRLKLELGDLYILTNEVWEASLIYQQVEKQFPDQPQGHEAKFRNARLSYFLGDFTWAKAQLDVLKGSTSQLIANDALNLSLMIAENTASAADSSALGLYASADMLLFKNQLPAALTALDSINNKYPGNSLADDILMAKAKIYLKQNDFQQAAVRLEQITAQYGFDLWADDALFMLGGLYEQQLQNPEKAKGYYQKLITEYPSSPHLSEARNRFRNLRADSTP